MSRAVGIDVSQRTLEVCPAPQVPSRTFANTASGIAATLAWLQPMQPTRIVFEARGGYETPLMQAVIAKGWPACRINARQIHHFAKALGQHAKTDPVDAAVLQRFGDLIEPAGCVLPDRAHAKLLALVKRRAQLVAIQTGEINRHHPGRCHTGGQSTPSAQRAQAGDHAHREGYRALYRAPRRHR